MKNKSPSIRFGALVLGLGLLLCERVASAQANDLLEPDVMLLIDSSGSMDWRDNTGRPDGMGAWDWAREACIAAAEADPPSAGESSKTSWQKLQDAFMGDIPSEYYRCSVHEPIQRPSLQSLRAEGIDKFLPDNISEYRSVSYPHFRAVSCPNPDNWDETFQQCIDGNKAPIVLDGITKCYDDADNLYTVGAQSFCLNMHPEAAPRRHNGILDSFSSTVRFGAMTYDNAPKCWENCSDAHNTRWDYGPYRKWNCGGIDDVAAVSPDSVCYDWNAGARGEYDGAVGGLVGIGLTPDSSNARVSTLLDSVEPLFCSPLGSLVDDVGYYFAHNKNVLPYGAMEGNDRYYRCRPKIAVLISDGQPTRVFESISGGCTKGDTSKDANWDPRNTDPLYTHEDPPPTRWDPLPENPDAERDKPEPNFDCPWRGTPEEAGELFDLGMRMVRSLSTKCTDDEGPLCQPVYLVVLGFNVPKDEDVDCTATKDACYRYTADYQPCWRGLAPCSADEGDAGMDEKGYCYMTPRELLNEVACQGWPWDPANTYTANYTSAPSDDSPRVSMRQPPWLRDGDDDPQICGDDPDKFPCRTYPGGYSDRALFVNSVDKIQQVMDMILVNMSAKVITRTDLVTWNRPDVDDTTVSQYEFRSGYLPRAGRSWQGVLTRKDWSCANQTTDDETGNVYNQDTGNNLTDVAALIAEQNPRNIYSYSLPAPPSDLSYVPLNLTNIDPWLAPNAVTIKEISNLHDCDFGVADYVGSWDLCVDKKLVAGIIADKTKDHGLADIYNSTPTVLGKPFDRLSLTSYQDFRNNQRDRRAHLFVGTNDGVLHAIDNEQIRTESGTDAAPEAWGFIPNAILRELMGTYSLPNIAMELAGDGTTVTGYHFEGAASGDDAAAFELVRHSFLLDLPPIARDVMLVRNRVEYNPDLETKAWRALVLGGTGKNSRGYFALDVTDAVKATDTGAKIPAMRFEINPDVGLYGNNPGDEAREAIDRLGMPMSKPALAYVNDNNGGTNTLVSAAAIIPGGWKENPDPNSADHHQHGNSGVYIVRLGDGKLIRYLEPMAAGAVADPETLDGKEHICKPVKNGGTVAHTPVGLMRSTTPDAEGNKPLLDGAQLIGEPIVPFGTRNLQVTTEAFIGDDRGRIWLIDMSNTDPAEWCLELYFDTLLSWHYPYEDCDKESCIPDSTCLHDDCCTGKTDNLPCDYKVRNMRAPRAMILGAPAISVDEENRLVMVFGTGQYDQLTSWNRNRVFSITDQATEYEETAADDTFIKHIVHIPSVNWWLGDGINDDFDEIDFDGQSVDQEDTYKDFLDRMRTGMITTQYTGSANPENGANNPTEFWNVGEKLIGRPVIFDSNVYFTTFVPLRSPTNPEDACEEGGSRVWGLGYDFNIVAATDAGNVSTIGAFIEDEEPIPFRDYPGEILSGVKAVKRPTCDAEQTSVFELVVQKVDINNDASPSGTPPGESVKVKHIAINNKRLQNIITVRFDSWSLVF